MEFAWATYKPWILRRHVDGQARRKEIHYTSCSESLEKHLGEQGLKWKHCPFTKFGALRPPGSSNRAPCPFLEGREDIQGSIGDTLPHCKHKVLARRVPLAFDLSGSSFSRTTGVFSRPFRFLDLPRCT